MSSSGNSLVTSDEKVDKYELALSFYSLVMLNNMQFRRLVILFIVKKDLQFSMFALCVHAELIVNAI